MNHANVQVDDGLKAGNLFAEIYYMRKENHKPVVRFFPDHCTKSPFWNTLDSDQGLDYYNFPLELFNISPDLYDVIVDWTKQFNRAKCDEELSDEWKHIGTMIFNRMKETNPNYSFVNWM